VPGLCPGKGPWFRVPGLESLRDMGGRGGSIPSAANFKHGLDGWRLVSTGGDVCRGRGFAGHALIKFPSSGIFSPERGRIPVRQIRRALGR